MKQIDDMAAAAVLPLESQPLAVTIGTALRRIRTRRGMTLNELAERCSTTAQTISRLETCEMTISVAWVEKLCKAMDVPPAILFDPGVAAEHKVRMEFRTKLAVLQTYLKDTADQAGDILKTMERNA